MQYKYGDITEKIIGCAMKVHTNLGCGFQELVYQKCLTQELDKAGLSYSREVEMPIYYEETLVGTRRVDLLVEAKILVELKAQKSLEPVHLAQAKNYLEAFHLEVGLLINFGEPSLNFKRLINYKKSPHTAINKSKNRNPTNHLNP